MSRKEKNTDNDGDQVEQDNGPEGEHCAITQVAHTHVVLVGNRPVGVQCGGDNRKYQQGAEKSQAQQQQSPAGNHDLELESRVHPDKAGEEGHHKRAKPEQDLNPEGPEGTHQEHRVVSLGQDPDGGLKYETKEERDSRNQERKKRGAAE